MKKMIPLSLVVATAMYATSVPVNTGWNLVGAISDIEPASLNCVKSVWTYDPSSTTNPWKLYQNIDLSQNFGYESLSTITAGQGFWLNSTCNTYVEFNNPTDPIVDENPFDLDTTSASLLNFSTFTNGVNIESGDSKWFSSFTRTDNTLNVIDYENYDGMWEIEDTFSGNITFNNEQNISLSFPQDGFGADFIIKDTQKVNAIGTQTFSDLYVSDIEIHVTAAGSGWTDTWDWGPKYYDQSTQQEVIVTTNTELLTMFLSSNHWFGGSDYALLDGNIGDTSGDVVAGTVTGYCDMDGDGVNDPECKIVAKTTDVIGSWSFATSGLSVELENESLEFSIVSSSQTDTGYTIQETGTDKVGSVWHEKMFTGSDATVDLIKGLLSN